MIFILSIALLALAFVMGYFVRSVFYEEDDRIKQILLLLQEIKEKEVTEIMTIADIKAKVEAQTTVIGSTKTLLELLSQMVKDAIAANDPAAMQAVADLLDANTTTLSDAVVANTPPPA